MKYLPLLAALAVTAINSALAGPQETNELTVRVTAQQAALRPGSVVLLTARASRALAALEGHGFDRTFGFWDSTVNTWNGLVGVPLDTAPGRYDVQLRASGSDGSTALTRIALTVTPGTFATRRLRVDPSFVEPPPSAAERIARDARVLANLFEQVTPARLWRGPFALPVAGPATSSYGRLTVFNGTPRGRHQGADFSAPEGTPVRAPNAGQVVLAEELYFAGNTVILDHGDGLYSLFAHLSQIEVAVGARVARGEHLGKAGATGRVTGPHVHWAVRLRNASVDPLSLVAALKGIDGVGP